MPHKDARLSKDRIAAFRDLFDRQLLGNYETISGVGSTLANSSRMRRALAEFLKGGISTVLDVGCGDFNWQRALPLDNIRMLAIDIVPEMIEQNRKKYPHPNVTFEVMDIVTTAPPKHDLVICRDLFSHFPHADIIAAFNHIKESGSRFLAATGYYPEIGHKKMMEAHQKAMNKNSPAGYWRPVQLRKPPFLFPKPLFTIQESQPGRALDIWRMEDLPLLTPDYLALSHTNPLEHEDFLRFPFYRKLCELDYVEKIGLYGSRATRTNRPDSDIDLLVYCPKATQREWLHICEIAEQAQIPFFVDCTRYTDNIEQYIFHFTPRILYERQR